MNTAACWAGSLRGCTGSRTRSSSGFSPARSCATSLWSSWTASLAPHGGRFDRQPVGAPDEEQLKLAHRVGAVRRQLGVQAEHAGPDAALERTHLLPLQAISRVAVRLPLAQRLGAQVVAPVLLVAVRAGEIHLAAARVIRFSANVQLLSRWIDLDRHASRLVCDIGSEREQLVRLVRERLSVPDLGFQRDDPAVLHRRVARRHALHRNMAGRAFLREQLRPLVHPQHAWVLRVARLQAADFFAGEFKARAILRFGRARNQRGENQIFPHEETTRCVLAAPCTSSSSSHQKSRSPDCVARRKKRRNGLAAMPVLSVARKTSMPLYRHTSEWIALRGTRSPCGARRKPVSIGCWITMRTSTSSPRLASWGRSILASAIQPPSVQAASRTSTKAAPDQNEPSESSAIATMRCEPLSRMRELTSARGQCAPR